MRVLLFGPARTSAGARQLLVGVPARGASAQSVVDRVVTEHPALRRIARTCRLFLNGEPIGSSRTLVRNGDELALHPPYGGG